MFSSGKFKQSSCPYETGFIFSHAPYHVVLFEAFRVFQGLSYLVVHLASLEFNSLPADELSAKAIPAQFVRLSQH